MTTASLKRRSLLAALGGLTLTSAARPSAAAGRRALDFASPDDILEATVKCNGTLEDGPETLYTLEREPA